jgi:hypothetical protein
MSWPHSRRAGGRALNRHPTFFRGPIFCQAGISQAGQLHRALATVGRPNQPAASMRPRLRPQSRKYANRCAQCWPLIQVI